MSPNIPFHYCIDVLAVMENWCLKLQERHGLVLEQEEFREKVMDRLDYLKDNDGPDLVRFMSDVECGREETAVECNETTYYANNLHWQNVALSPQASPLPNIRGFKEDFIRNLQREITSYFPQGSFKNFLIFDNRKFPEINDNVENFGTQEIVQLANSFNLPPVETSEEWATLLQNLSRDPDFCRKKKAHPSDFWIYYVFKKPELFHENIKRMVLITLVLPTGSADAERAFSHLNLIKTKTRNRISPSLLDNLLRIKINAVKKVEDFPAISLAKTWVLRGNPRADTPFNRKRPREDSDEMEQEFDDEAIDDSIFMDIEIV